MNFKKKYAPILHLLPKGKAGRPSKEDQLERIKMANALMKKFNDGDLTLEIVPTKATEQVEVTPEVAEETDEQTLERMKTKFQNINEYANGVVSGAINALVVSGPGGIGKTETLVRVFEAAHEEGKIRFEHIKGGAITPIHFYKLLYEHCTEDWVILIDDVDRIYNSEDSLNLLKAALDTSIEKKISWNSEAALLRNNNIPPSFKFKARIVFITNRDILNEIETGRGKDVDHLEAFADRTAYISLRMKTKRELYLWATYMTKTNFILRQLGISDENAEEIYEFAKENYKTFRNVSIRTYINIGRARLMSENRWKELALETLAA